MLQNVRGGSSRSFSGWQGLQLPCRVSSLDQQSIWGTSTTSTRHRSCLSRYKGTLDLQNTPKVQVPHKQQASSKADKQQARRQAQLTSSHTVRRQSYSEVSNSCSGLVIGITSSLVYWLTASAWPQLLPIIISHLSWVIRHLFPFDILLCHSA